MSSTPSLEKFLPAQRGQRRYVAIGFVIRVMKLLPAALRERLMDSAMGGVTADVPPFADTLRLVESAGGVPDGARWKQRLLQHRPDLSAVRVRDINEDAHGRVRARLYLPPEDAPAAKAALVWVHGGAFILGSLDQHEAHWPAIELAAKGIPVLSVDYRQAINGVHYPVPHEDVLSAWQWAVEHVEQLGVTADQLHLGGGSAGGCLVAGVVLRLRDTNQTMPASMYLAYPVLEGTLPPAPPHMAAALSAQGLPTDDWVRGMFANWAGGESWSNPYVAPGLADLVGLPASYVLSCGVDTLRRASEPFAERLQHAGVTTWHDLLPDSRHAPYDRPESEDGEFALERLRAWLTGGITAMNNERP